MGATPRCTLQVMWNWRPGITLYTDWELISLSTGLILEKLAPFAWRGIYVQLGPWQVVVGLQLRGY
jgi:hypothetical protein